ncbi:single-stranded-DNA-specific exonuclease RecJ [Limnothrix sp. PR1529]|uniref:single-stranded-DNA-specific exonuclease RecJ n=1 Tax=Limnothrix sp. PR1529 TaxID=1704291 RepID=UPI00081DC7E7|nr:single-stranded-DNA-specific exonuclease RecJ [Limnothrix sp. PR1529]OCQ95820.1 single-stranded-DNA-specific exonuclease RecJ [Limnothrix sp. P13C2]
MDIEAAWQFPIEPPPVDWVAAVQSMLDRLDAVQVGNPKATDLKESRSPQGDRSRWLAQVLWERGWRDPRTLAGWLSAEHYQPTGPEGFGSEMAQAIARLVLAHERGDRVAIWGDFDADGVTATAVLWDGLGQFFPRGDRLTYFVPDRLKESHGLSRSGLAALAAAGWQLIVTCDTGSTNLAELAIARDLGLEVIVTDHHSLPDQRPDLVALVNPRALPIDSPLASLSGVAVAYKLVEALYQALPTVPQQPLAALLDLVAIGLIADLVELRGDARYLAQVGLQHLQKTDRPGLQLLLERCKKTGDRPSDIAFGLGPRINAASRIYGDAHFCIELLTSRDRDRCRQLADQVEAANSRRKALQNDVLWRARSRLAAADWSTTAVIVLAEAGWPLGVLGLVAGQLAQEFNRPVVLLTLEGDMAKGSARSLPGLDFYEVLKQQTHLLDRFGGHPLAAGLALPVANLDLFTQALEREVRQRCPARSPQPITADLTVTVADLLLDRGRALFQALKWLEPCGMGNPAPRLLIRQVRFQNLQVRRLHLGSQKLRYLHTRFEIQDDSATEPFPGIWWDCLPEAIPKGSCDLVAELDFNARDKCYQLRPLAVRPADRPLVRDLAGTIPVWDYRQGLPAAELPSPTAMLWVDQCPTRWEDWQQIARQALDDQRPIALTYQPILEPSPDRTWQTLLGMAKYLSRTGQTVDRAVLSARLALSPQAIELGLNALAAIGLNPREQDGHLRFQPQALDAMETEATTRSRAIAQFWAIVQEERFHHQYFATMPPAALQDLDPRLQPR